MRSDIEFKSKVMRAANKIHNAGGCDAADMRRSSRFVEIKRQKGSIRKSGTMSICRRKGLRRHTAVEQSREFMQSIAECILLKNIWVSHNKNRIRRFKQAPYFLCAASCRGSMPQKRRMWVCGE